MLPEIIQWLKFYLGAESFQVEAAVDQLGEVPRFCLDTKTFNPIQLGHLQIPFRLQMCSLFKVLEKSGKLEVRPYTLYRLSAIIQYKYDSDKMLSIPIDAVFYGLSPVVVVLSADTGELSQLALVKFSQLLADTPLLEWIPKGGFPALDAVILKELSLVASVKERKLLEINGIFALNDKYATYEIIPGLLKVSSMELGFSVSDPLGDKKIDAYIEGIAQLEGTSDVKGDLLMRLDTLQSNVAFTLELEDGGSIDITNLINALLPYPLRIGPIECDSLSLNGAKFPARFTFFSVFKSHICIPLLFVAIKELRLGFEYKKSQDSPEAAVIPGSIHLAGLLSVNDKVDISLAGEWQDGWRFEGAFSVDKEPLQINDLLPREIQLPEEIANLALKKGHVTVDIGKKSLDIVVEIESHLKFGEFGEMEGSSFSLHFEGLSGNSYKWEITAKGRIKLLEAAISGIVKSGEIIQSVQKYSDH